MHVRKAHAGFCRFPNECEASLPGYLSGVKWSEAGLFAAADGATVRLRIGLLSGSTGYSSLIGIREGLPTTPPTNPYRFGLLSDGC